MMMTKFKKKILAAIVVWQSLILIFTLFSMAVSYEPLTFLPTYLSIMWGLTLTVALFGAMIFGIIYLVDD